MCNINCKMKLLGVLIFIGLSALAFGQEGVRFLQVPVEQLSGRLTTVRHAADFGRLPLAIKEELRDPVWNLGRNSAGLYVDFKTNSQTINVRYAVKGRLNMPHMPTTGVSGVDLYFKGHQNKNWEWAFGRYQFKDTISYVFSSLKPSQEGVYRLYLPLYNSISFLDIGVPEESSIEFVKDNQKPIVVYGTSIAQGACATRPGLAWTSILGRSFDNEVINLGFSGNGRLEKPILDLLIEEDAAVYILDCIPNLSLSTTRSAEQLDSLLQASVTYIRTKRPDVPIVLAQHSSAFTLGFINNGTLNEYGSSSEVVQQSFDKLKKRGVKNIYFLSSKAMGLDINSTVDYAHPNDIGMMKIANAYVEILKNILR